MRFWKQLLFLPGDGAGVFFSLPGEIEKGGHLSSTTGTDSATSGVADVDQSATDTDIGTDNSSFTTTETGNSISGSYSSVTKSTDVQVENDVLTDQGASDSDSTTDSDTITLTAGGNDITSSYSCSTTGDGQRHRQRCRE